MYICYVDESGHCGTKFNPNQPVEVLCGVITDVTKLFKSQREHQALLSDLGLEELKSANAYRGRKEWQAVSPPERVALFEKVLNWASERSAKFIVAPIDSKKFFDRKAHGCPFSAHLEYPYEAGALNVILAVQRLQKNKARNKGKTIVIFDEQSGHDESFLRTIADDLSFTDGYTGYTVPKKGPPKVPRLNEIVDVPHFSKSHLTMLIQVADLAAFIVNRYLLLALFGEAEAYAGEAARLKSWYEQIGANRVVHTATDPPGKDPLCRYYREELRPTGWSAKAWSC